MRRIFFGLFALLVFVSQCHAETIAATASGRVWTLGTTTGAFSTVQAAVCAQYLAVNNGGGWWVYVGPAPQTEPVAPTNSVQTLCSILNAGVPDVIGGYTISAGAALYTCPADQGWTLSGTTCTRADCSSGQTRNGSGVCESPCGASGATWNGSSCECPGFSQDFISADKTCVCNSARYEGRGTSIGGTGIAPVSDTSCYGGCVVNHGSFTISAGTGASANWASSIKDFTATKCTDSPPTAAAPAPDTRTPAQKCLASGGGYITTSTGTVCTTTSDAPETVTTSKSGSTVNKDATGAVTGSTEVATTCVGAECTTVTTVKDAAGTVLSTSTAIGAAEGAGGGGGGGNGDGDEPSECSQFPDRVGCKDLGTPEGSDELENVTRGVESITQQSFGASNSCPSDIPLPKGSALSFSYPCQLATSLRPLLLALAWLAAGLMVMGVFRDG